MKSNRADVETVTLRQHCPALSAAGGVRLVNRAQGVEVEAARAPAGVLQRSVRAGAKLKLRANDGRAAAAVGLLPEEVERAIDVMQADEAAGGIDAAHTDGGAFRFAAAPRDV